MKTEPYPGPRIACPSCGAHYVHGGSPCPLHEAAPDLLAALKGAAHDACPAFKTCRHDVCERRKRAIAKAEEGKS